MVNHRQSNPVKCLYCSFSSTGEAAIQRHMAEHHNQSELPLAMRRQFPDMDETTEGILAIKLTSCLHVFYENSAS